MAFILLIGDLDVEVRQIYLVEFLDVVLEVRCRVFYLVQASVERSSRRQTDADLVRWGEASGKQ